MDILLSLRWHLQAKQTVELNPELVELLDGMAVGGNLRYATREAGLSYRHAWGLLKHWEQYFGQSLVTLERGRGAVLTPAGELLRETWHKTNERLTNPLAEAAAHARLALGALFHSATSEPLRIAASHGFGLNVLRDLLRAAGCEVDLQFLGSEVSLERYARGECEMAGFHLANGPLGARLWARFQPLLDPRRDSLLLVETRELGFITRPGVACARVQDIAARKLRFLNRQAGSGSRLVFDLLLADAGLKPSVIAGYHNEEYTHLAVAAVIAGGAADVGFGARAAADKFGLEFSPEVTEKYFLVLRREAIHRQPYALLGKLLASRAYRQGLADTAGCDPRGSGKRLELRQLAGLLKFSPRSATRVRSAS